ncbi:hypothetical protein BC833DRAFT_578986, partial [Globomyces pollinis-pini]
MKVLILKLVRFEKLLKNRVVEPTSLPSNTPNTANTRKRSLSPKRSSRLARKPVQKSHEQSSRKPVVKPKPTHDSSTKRPRKQPILDRLGPKKKSITDRLGETVFERLGKPLAKGTVLIGGHKTGSAAHILGPKRTSGGKQLSVGKKRSNGR